MMKKKVKTSKPGMAKYARFSGIGFQMIATIALFTWIGYQADQKFHHETPWVTAILSLIGVCLSIYLVIRQATKSNPHE